MDNKKFEQLIDLIINENEEKASALFHEIVVEKSREIYESLMEYDMEEGMEEGMGGQTGDLADEISSEEEGMDVNFDDEDEEDMDDDEMDMDMDDEEEVVDLDSDEDEESDEELEDRVVDLEDKLEMLMAEFEEIMGKDSDEEDSADEEDMEADEEDMEADEEETDEEEVDQDEETVSEEDMAVMEAINLLKVKGLYDSHIGGDNGDNAHSPVAFNSGQKGMASHPVKLGSDQEAGKRTVNVKDVKDATNWKNVPAKGDQKLESAPKPVHKDEASGVRSPVAESKRTVKKTVKSRK